MTLPAADGTKNWIGRTVVDRDGAEIGVCAALLTDTETGQPEWLEVERHGVTLVVPLLDAHESGQRVHVSVTRAYADGAPRFGATRELSRDQEAALYRHYGIEYSAATSDSLLPTEAPPTDARPTAAQGAAAGAAVRQLVAGDAARRGAGAAAAAAVLLGPTAAVVAVVRRRGGTSPRSGRLLRRAAPPPARARRPLAVPASARARSQQVAAAAGPALAALTPLLATSGHAAWHAVRAGTDSALRLTDAATEAVVDAVPRVTAGTARTGRTGLRALHAVGAAAEAVPEVIAETGGRLEKSWRHAVSRLSLGLGFGVGYVLGARAGRARYEQIKQAAAGVVERPEVQQALGKARAAAPAPLQGSIDKLSRRSRGHGAGTGGRPGAGAPLPDPLVPPATSGDTL